MLSMHRSGFPSQFKSFAHAVLIARAKACSDVAVLVGVGVEVEASNRSAVVDHHREGKVGGARGINREVEPVRQPKKPVESIESVERVESADVATLVNSPHGGLSLFEVNGGEPVSLRPPVAVEEFVRIAVVANDLHRVVDLPAIGREEAGIVEDREVTVVTQ